MKGRCLDLVAALLLMFFIPAITLHVKARDREFEICAARADEYIQLIRRQGYCTAETIRELTGTGSGILAEAKLVLEVASGQNGWKYAALEETETINYLGEQVYPFHTGDLLRFQITMHYDGLERFYFGFCFWKLDGRRSIKSGAIRDGLLERLAGGEI